MGVSNHTVLREPTRPIMGELALKTERQQARHLLVHAAGFVLVFLAADWLRDSVFRPDPILQGYLQITIGLFAFVFAAVTLVRFQGTQDRISLILGSGFLLSGATLTASSILFFQMSGTIRQLGSCGLQWGGGSAGWCWRCYLESRCWWNILFRGRGIRSLKLRGHCSQ